MPRWLKLLMILTGSGAIALLFSVISFPTVDAGIALSLEGAQSIAVGSSEAPLDFSRCDSLYIEVTRPKEIQFRVALQPKEKEPSFFANRTLAAGTSVEAFALSESFSDRSSLEQITALRFECSECRVEGVSAAGADWRTVPARMLTGMGLTFITLIILLANNFLVARRKR